MKPGVLVYDLPNQRMEALDENGAELPGMVYVHKGNQQYPVMVQSLNICGGQANITPMRPCMMIVDCGSHKRSITNLAEHPAFGVFKRHLGVTLCMN